MKKNDLIPKDAKKLEHKTIAEGEMTGHRHQLVGDGTLYMHAGIMYAEVEKAAVVTHEEHHDTCLDPDVYRIGGVKEYDHFKEEARRVAD